jgi:hypothetical protein
MVISVDECKTKPIIREFLLQMRFYLKKNAPK